VQSTRFHLIMWACRSRRISADGSSVSH
jgi:hypothetical protein